MPLLPPLQGMASQFEQLALGPGQSPVPGQPPDGGADVPHFPRPLGSDAAAAEPAKTVDPHSCDPAYLRPTTTCFPGTQTLRSRYASIGGFPNEYRDSLPERDVSCVRCMAAVERVTAPGALTTIAGLSAGS